MPNTIKTISLTDDDKSYLNKLLTQSTLEIRVYQCARILLLKSEGASSEAIADKLDIGIGVVNVVLINLKRTVLKLLYMITTAVKKKRKSPMTISPGESVKLAKNRRITAILLNSDIP